MSSGERPIGAAKGKQSDTEALCQTAPPPLCVLALNGAERRRCYCNALPASHTLVS